MTSKGEPALLEAFLTYGKEEIWLDKRTKAALRLCSKHCKSLVDATVTKARVASSPGRYIGDLNAALNALINTEWHDLQELNVNESWLRGPNPLEELPSALSNFPG
jgi:hypothetical protein